MKIIAILEQGPTYNYVAHLYFIVPRNRLSQITSQQIVLVRKYSNRCYKPYRIAGISKDFVINRNCIDILKFHNQDQTFFTSHFLLSRQVSFNGLRLFKSKDLVLMIIFIFKSYFWVLHPFLHEYCGTENNVYLCGEMWCLRGFSIRLYSESNAGFRFSKGRIPETEKCLS